MLLILFVLGAIFIFMLATKTPLKHALTTVALTALIIFVITALKSILQPETGKRDIKLKSEQEVSNVVENQMSSEKTREQIKFSFVNAELQNEIVNERFFVLNSRFGFVVDVFNQSPLQDNIPKKVVDFGPSPPPPPIGSGGSGTSTVVVQTIPTETIANYYIEGGFFFDNIFNSIYRTIPARPIFYLPFKLVHGILGLIFSIVTDAYTNLFYLVVDNSLSDDLRLVLDRHKPVNVPARRQIRLIFRRGNHGIEITRRTDGTRIESFYTDFSVPDANKDAHFIYNVLGKNSYKISHVSYSRK